MYLKTAVAVVALACASLAHASAYQVEARTEAQAYQIRSYRDSDPANPILLPRRRVVQYLGLNVFELVTGQPFAFESSMRIYADLGLPRGEAARIDGLHSEEADLLYANISYTGPALEFRVGRQMYVDLMDYMAFDGLEVRYLLDNGFGAEAYAGLWVKGSSLLGSSVYQPDGTRESDLRRLAALVPGASTSADDVEPVFGVKALGSDIMNSGVSASLAYRRALLTGKTDVERFAAEARYGKGRGVNGVAGLEYDLLMSRLSQFRVEARYDATYFAGQAELMRVSPVLSSDSIFLYFATAPRDELRIRGDFTPVGPLRYYAGVVADVYSAPLNEDATSVAAAKSDPGGYPSASIGANGGAALKLANQRAGADITFKNGFGGSQLWLDVTAGHTDPDALWSIDARLSLANISDQLNPLLRGTFIGGQIWGSYQLAPAARVSMVLEQNVNPFTRSDTKLFFLFDLKTRL